MRLALAALLLACSHPAPQAPSTLPVRITAWPQRPMVDCMLPDIPSSPPMPDHDSPMMQPDAFSRVVVHVREYEDALIWMDQARGWMMEMRECVKKLGAAPW